MKHLPEKVFRFSLTDRQEKLGLAPKNSPFILENLKLIPFLPFGPRFDRLSFTNVSTITNATS